MSLFTKKIEDKKKDLEKSVKISNVKKVEKKEDIKDVKENKKLERKYGNAYRVLVKPLITEKATGLGVENKYIFAVEKKSNKIEIAKAIDEIYGIKPVSVNVINMKGKKSRYGKITGKRKDWKKAIIELPKGKTIKIYEGV